MGTGASLSLPDDDLRMETYKQICALFDKLDKAGHKMLSRSDFNDLCESVPGHFSSKDSQQAFKHLDKNRNSSIELNEFVAWWDGISPNENLPQNNIKVRMEAFRREISKKHKIGYGFSLQDLDEAKKLDPKEVKTWNPSQTFLWLITCPQLQVVRKEIDRGKWADIDGETLLEMSDDDLKRKGVEGYHIKKMRHAIDQHFNRKTGSSNINISNNANNTWKEDDTTPTITISSSTDPKSNLPVTPRKPMKSPMHGGNGGGSFKWKKGDLLGQGAYGRVFSGMDLDTGVSMAVKEMTFTKDNAKEVEEFKNEIMLLRRLKHDHIVQYFGAEIPEDGNGCIIHIFTELMPQGSLLSLLKKYGNFSESMTQNYTRQMISGLIYLHENQIIHRDIKPANVLVNESGIVKLADFGASKKMAGTETVAIENTTLKGTPYFMAPEVLMQKGHGRKADVWSLGATVLQLVSGDPPWKKMNFDSVVQLMCHVAQDENATPTLPEKGTVSEDLHSFIDTCFERNVELRPTSKKLANHPFVQLDESQIYVQSNADGSDDKLNNTMEQIERSLSNVENSSGNGSSTMGSTLDKSVEMDMSFSVVSDETSDMTATKSIIEQENSDGGKNPFARNGAFANADGNVVAKNSPKRRNNRPLITTVEPEEKPKKKKKKKKRKNRPGMSHYAEDSSDEDANQGVFDQEQQVEGQALKEGESNLWKQREDRPINSSYHQENLKTLSLDEAAKAQEDVRKAELASLQQQEIANYKSEQQDH